MKINLVKMALLIVLVMAAILPNCAFAEITIGPNLHSEGANQQVTFVTSPNLHSEGSNGQSNFIGYGQSTNHTNQNNQNMIVIGGNSGGAFKTILENRLRVMMAKIGISADSYQLTGTADLNYTDKGFALGQSQGALGVRWHKATVIVHLELLTADNGYMADVSLSKTLDWNIAGITTGSAGTFGTGRQAAENEFLYQAGNQALTSLVNQIQPVKTTQSPTFSRPAVKVSGSLNLVFPSGLPTTINVPQSNPVGENDQIWFVNTANQVTGKYTVSKLNAQTAILAQVQGFQSVEPKNGDGFAIIYPK